MPPALPAASIPPARRIRTAWRGCESIATTPTMSRAPIWNRNAHTPYATIAGHGACVIRRATTPASRCQAAIRRRAAGPANRWTGSGRGASGTLPKNPSLRLVVPRCVAIDRPSSPVKPIWMTPRSAADFRHSANHRRRELIPTRRTDRLAQWQQRPTPRQTRAPNGRPPRRPGTPSRSGASVCDR